MTEPAACAICDFGGPGLRQALVHWKPPIRPTWDFVTRCVDRLACAERCKAAGEPWPVVEADHSEPSGTDKSFRPHTDALARRREYAEWIAAHPGLTDPRPPVLDPRTGNVRFLPPQPLEPIPVIPETERPPVVPDNPKEWW